MSARWAVLVVCALLSDMASGGEPGAITLGPLFFTPEQRLRLDRAPVDDPDAEPDAPAQARRVDGLVHRSGGNVTVWVDGKPMVLGRDAAGRSASGLTVDGDTVTIPDADGRPVRLRPGPMPERR